MPEPAIAPSKAQKTRHSAAQPGGRSRRATKFQAQDEDVLELEWRESRDLVLAFELTAAWQPLIVGIQITLGLSLFVVAFVVSVVGAARGNVAVSALGIAAVGIALAILITMILAPSMFRPRFDKSQRWMRD